ncbi:hypothetical protein KAR91_53555 [Candidatus Pacearchaeota archaeon]|nr:hypothetical protein [Candidatus Pacearchaeota archaeon]
MNYSAMRNKELIDALKLSQKDCENQGAARAALKETFKKEKCEFIGRMKELTSQRHRNDDKINNQAVEITDLKAVIEERNATIEIRNKNNRFLNERNVKLEGVVKELTDKLTVMENRYNEISNNDTKLNKRQNDHIIKLNNRIADLKAKLAAADQQSAEYKSMAENCGAGEIRELKECNERQSKTIDKFFKKLDIADDSIIDLRAKNKCLKDELGMWQNNESFGATIAAEDIQHRNNIIEKLNNEIEHLKSMATTADYSSLLGDFALLSHAFIGQGVKKYTGQELITAIDTVHKD